MSGYAGRPDATRTTVRRGWLRTGDVGHLDAEGYLHLTDRLADVIVSGGEKVDSAVVEQALGARSAVAGAGGKLVEVDGFAEFFADVTPAEELGELPLGSRPARRGGGGRDLASLRAIPWSFAWAQARINLPGWYGLGAGLAAGRAHVGGMQPLRELMGRWPFLRTAIDNAALSLVKADMLIARTSATPATSPGRRSSTSRGRVSPTPHTSGLRPRSSPPTSRPTGVTSTPWASSRGRSSRRCSCSRASESGARRPWRRARATPLRARAGPA